MSRTRRRIGAEYRYILPSTDTTVPMTDEDRLWVIRFHSDHYPKWGSPPREFVRLYKRKMNRHNDRMLRRWLNDPEFDPVFDVKTYHRAQWAWN